MVKSNKLLPFLLRVTWNLQLKITAAAKDKGIKVNEESFDLHLNMQGMTFFAPAGGDLTKEQINEVDAFVDKVLAKL